MGLGTVQGGRRDRTEILRDILECIYRLQNDVAVQPVPKTQVMRCSNLNTRSFQQYISVLFRSGLVTTPDTGNGLVITPQGLLTIILSTTLMNILAMHTKQEIVTIGMELYKRLARQGAHNVLVKPRIPLLDDCEYLVASNGPRAVCLRENSERVIELVCCESGGCYVIDSLTITDFYSDYTRVLQRLTPAAEECLAGRRPAPRREAD